MYIFSYDRRMDVSAQNIDLSGNLDVSGSSTLSTLNVSGLATFSGGISADKFSVADTTGDTIVGNTLFIGTNDNSPTAKTIKFGGTLSDNNYEHSVIETRVYGSSEKSELLLFKGGDTTTALGGPDRIRLRASEINFDTNTVGTDRTSENIRMTILANGNVGIGTTIPASTLEVNGNLRVKAAATSSTVSHVPVFISDPATNAQTLVTRLPADFRVQIGALDQVNLGFQNGTTAGPTITSSGGTSVVIPSATDGVSGIVTTGNQTFAGDKTFSGNTTTNGTLSVKAATTTSVPLAIPVFTSAPSSSAQLIETRTPEQLLSDISGVSSLNAQTIAGDKTFSGNTTTNGTLSVKAATTTSVPLAIPVFTSAPSSSAQTIVTRTPAQLLADISGVGITGDQTIAGNKTFTGNTSMTGKVGMGGAVSTEQLKVYGDVNVTGNITKNNIQAVFPYYNIVSHYTDFGYSGSTYSSYTLFERSISCFSASSIFLIFFSAQIENSRPEDLNYDFILYRDNTQVGVYYNVLQSQGQGSKECVAFNLKDVPNSTNVTYKLTISNSSNGSAAIYSPSMNIIEYRGFD